MQRTFLLILWLACASGLSAQNGGTAVDLSNFSNQGIVVSDDDSIDINDGFTIEMWVRLDQRFHASF